MVILGIDPGLARIGYGVIKKNKKGEKSLATYLDCGLIETFPDVTRPERLQKIHNDINKLIRQHKPAILVMENVYFFKNLKTIIPVSQAGGVILLAAAKNKIPVFGFTPLQVKMALTGFGRAEKSEVQKSIKKYIKKTLLLKEFPKQDDTADALAIALTYIIKET